MTTHLHEVIPDLRRVVCVYLLAKRKQHEEILRTGQVRYLKTVTESTF